MGFNTITDDVPTAFYGDDPFDVYSGKIDAANAKLDEMVHEAARLRKVITAMEHMTPENCPVYYDGCHCAESFESLMLENDRLRAALAGIADEYGYGFDNAELKQAVKLFLNPPVKEGG